MTDADGEMLRHEIEALAEAIEGHDLDAGNDAQYLVGLVRDACENEHRFDSDQQMALWVVSQWCQEVGLEPDLSAFGPGECIDYGSQEARR